MGRVIFADEYERRCREWSDIQDHLPLLFELGRDNVRLIELGVRSGNSTAAFLAGIEESGKGHLWSVDIVDPQVSADWFKSSAWTFILGDDLEVAARIPSYADVVFIDTSHAYDQTIAELDLYAPKLMPGGVFVLHDIELEWPEEIPPGPAFPVRTAVEDWAKETGWPVDIYPGSFGLAVIHKPKPVPDA